VSQAFNFDRVAKGIIIQNLQSSVPPVCWRCYLPALQIRLNGYRCQAELRRDVFPLDPLASEGYDLFMVLSTSRYFSHLGASGWLEVQAL
jgi:hypothetical protein